MFPAGQHLIYNSVYPPVDSVLWPVYGHFAVSPDGCFAPTLLTIRPRRLHETMLNQCRRSWGEGVGGEVPPWATALPSPNKNACACFILMSDSVVI